jgi:hypothetical protein
MENRPIQIEGLSPTQVALANRLWTLEDTDEVNNFIDSLPRRLRGQARVVRDMMIAAALDQYEGPTDLAKHVIDSVK